MKLKKKTIISNKESMIHKVLEESKINYNESEINNSKSEINTFVKTPEHLYNKKCAINTKNIDNKCFQYSATLSIGIGYKLEKIWI